MLSRETIEIFPSPLAISEYIRKMGKEVYFNHTFYTFGKILLSLAAELLEERFITDFEKEVILKRICSKYFTGRKKSYFYSVFSKPGFIRDLKKSVKMLKKAAAGPEVLKAHMDNSAGKRLSLKRLSDFFSIYSEYTDFCRDYDDMGWLVVDALGKAEKPPLFLKGIKKIVVRPRYQLTNIQLKLLEVFAGRGIKVAVHFPCDESNAAFEANLPSSGYLKRMNSRNIRVEGTVSGDARYPSDLALAQKTLFSPAGSGIEAKDGSIRIIEAANRNLETREIALCIKKHLCGDKYLKPSDIVVIAKKISLYDDHIRQHFSRAKIPYYFRRGKQLQHANFYKDLMLILSMAEDRFPRENIARVIGAPYFADIGIDKDAAGLILCLCGYLSADNKPVDRCLSWLNGPGRETKDFINSGIDGEDVKKLGEFLAGFIRDISFKTGRTAKDFSKWLRGFIGRYYVGNMMAGEISAVCGLLDKIDACPEDIMGSSVVSAAQFKEMVESLAEREVIHEKDNLNAVRILTPFDTDGMNFKIGIFCGMVEGEFPSRKTEGLILKDADIEEMNRILDEKGMLPVQKSADEEIIDRNIFYRSFLGISDKCIFTVPFTEETREDRKKSVFLEEIEMIFSSELDGKITSTLEAQRITPSHVINEPDNAASRGELLTSIAKKGRGKEIILQPAGLLEEFERNNTVFKRNPNICAPGADGNYRGLYSSEELKRFLSDKFFRDGLFSFNATALEAFLRCPFRYFMQSLMKIRDFPRPELYINVMDEGTIIHEVLENFCRERKKGGGEKLLLDIAARVFDSYERSNLTGRKELWSVKKEGMSETLRNFLKLEEKSPIGPGKTEFLRAEFPFKRFKAVLRGENIMLDGYIDRIDISKTGVVYVVDYKTSRQVRSEEDFREGYLAQAALYKLVLSEKSVQEDMGIKSPPEIRACYFLLKADPFDEKAEFFSEVAVSGDWEDILLEKIIKFREAVARMEFPARPFDRRVDCANCDFPYLCRIAEDWGPKA
ncbi:MAG: exodeoxyribonuclease V subunit gamma [Candidatus Aureabacteria bacterium]|nr:exodeoxyribonuclease V subunit gamma [Candidatus Auribacterota bacterium]